MKRWFDSLAVSTVARGNFVRWDLTLAGDLTEFLNELGKRTAEAYLAPITAYGSAWQYAGFDPLRYAQRLFRSDGSPKQKFIDFAGEVLAAWCDEAYSSNVCGRPPIPHDSTPGFDSVSYAALADGSIQVWLTQAKTTEHHAAHHANIGAKKLAGIEAGDYQREVSAALKQVADLFDDDDDKRKVMAAVFSPDVRRYRVVVVHTGAHPGVVLSRFDKHVPGPTEKRNGAFVELPNWDETWTQVAWAAHAALSRDH